MLVKIHKLINSNSILIRNHQPIVLPSMFLLIINKNSITFYVYFSYSWSSEYKTKYKRIFMTKVKLNIFHPKLCLSLKKLFEEWATIYYLSLLGAIYFRRLLGKTFSVLKCQECRQWASVPCNKLDASKMLLTLINMIGHPITNFEQTHTVNTIII